MSAARVLTVVAACLGSAAVAAEPPGGKRYALLVGVNAYEHDNLPALRYAVADATETADVLAKAGYEVVLLSDAAGAANGGRAPTKANIEKSLREVLDKCGKVDTAVVALAGHGVQFEAVNDAFFCPRDAKPFPDRVETLVSLGGIYKELEQSSAGVKVLLVDACRDDPTRSRSGRRSGVTADSVRPPRGVAALFSCSANEFAREHKDYGHGVFFHHVLKGLRGEAKNARGDVTFGGLCEYVSTAVAEDVPRLVPGAKQSPNLKADLSGASPVLLRSSSGVPDPMARTVPDPKPRPDDPPARGGKVNPFTGRPIDDAPGRVESTPSPPPPYRPAADTRVGLDVFLYSLDATTAATAGVDLKDAGMTPFVSFVIPGGGGDRMGLRAYDVIGSVNGTPPDDWHHAFRLMEVAPEAVELSVLRKGRRLTLRGPYESAGTNASAYRKVKGAADTGDPMALMALGWVTANGQGVEADLPAAVRLYKRAAADGWAPAKTLLGNLHINGAGVAKDAAAGAAYYREAAEQGDPEAMNYYGVVVSHGLGLSADRVAGFRWFKRAADRGLLLARANVGWGLVWGHGVEADPAKGFAMIEEAAERDVAHAKFMVGRCHEIGVPGVVGKDAEAAVRWYRKAARQNEAEAIDALKRLGEYKP